MDSRFLSFYELFSVWVVVRLYGFLLMNLSYTMTPEMVADAAKVFKPKILYPYHYGQTDPNIVVNLLKDSKEITVRIRKMR